MGSRVYVALMLLVGAPALAAADDAPPSALELEREREREAPAPVRAPDSSPLDYGEEALWATAAGVATAVALGGVVLLVSFAPGATLGFVAPVLLLSAGLLPLSIGALLGWALAPDDVEPLELALLMTLGGVGACAGAGAGAALGGAFAGSFLTAWLQRTGFGWSAAPMYGSLAITSACLPLLTTGMCTGVVGGLWVVAAPPRGAASDDDPADEDADGEREAMPF